MATDLATLLPFRPKRERPRIRLICLPFAGGAASVYRLWGTALPDHVDVCAVELPGRGTRFGEEALQDPGQLLAELAPVAKLADLPTVYFGHSLGGRVAFALIRGGARADALIVSASRAAHVTQPNVRSSLPKEALVRELRRLGGTPRAVLDEPEMLNLALPMVRADFRILETLTASPDDKIACPLTVIAATNDGEVALEHLEKWKVHATGDYRFVTVSGGHFFLSTDPEKALIEVRRVLDETLASLSG